ncbi:MAG: ABC transporter substrate-binding protein [Candidatus Methylumidiphilus sp.]
MTDQTKPDALWYTRCSIPTPLGLGAQLGWYRDEFSGDGITIKSLQESNDPAEQASHFEHSLPHSFRLGGSVPAIWTKAKGRATRVIGISWIDEYQAIITLPTSGIRTPADLRGRKLGLPTSNKRKDSVDVARATALRGLLLGLELAGLEYKDAEWIDVASSRDVEQSIQAPDTSVRRRRAHSYTDTALALARGEVDAIYVKDVRGAETAHLLGAHVVVQLGFHPDAHFHINNSTPRPLTVNQDTLDRYPDLVQRFLSRVRDVDGWARQNPAAAVREIASETNWTESWVRFAYGEKVHLSLGVELSERNIAGLTEYKDFLLKWDFIEKDFSVREWIDPAPLLALAESAQAA